MKATGAKETIIGIEANKQDAANHLETSKNKAPNKGISLQLSLLKSMLCPANAKKNS